MDKKESESGEGPIFLIPQSLIVFILSIFMIRIIVSLKDKFLRFPNGFLSLKPVRL